ncbi:NAD(+) kinase [Opitutaceae bacterium EW11]|nr:NAD(+) kinase [Opitutaceae bacterium EW11]
MQPIRTLAFVVNDSKSGAPELAKALIALAEERGVEVRASGLYPTPPGSLRGCDACCVIGGDGTLLGVVTEAARENVPVIGVNRGSLGFLTTFSGEEARQLFPAILEGQYCLANRSLLECSTGPGQHDLALNDVLIKDEFSSRLVRLEVFADDELVTEYYCDGLIFSTPTGSTAYNLSAGGPLIHPGAEVIAMTPICPHTLSNRSIIFRHDVCLRVFHRVERSRVLVAMDGQRKQLTCENSPIEISISPKRLALVQRCDYSHFAVVRTKLKWSGGYVESPNPRS